MTAIYVQPDTEYHERWQFLGFTVESDCTPEQVAKAAAEALKLNIPVGERLEKWQVIWSLNNAQKRQLYAMVQAWADINGTPMMATYPWLRKAWIQGDREALVSGASGGVLLPYAGSGTRGKTDWQVGILVRRPKFQTPKYHEPLGPAEGFELRENSPASLQEGIGAETTVRVIE